MCLVDKLDLERVDGRASASRKPQGYLREGRRTPSDDALYSSIQCFDLIDRAQSYRAKREEKARVEQKKESGREGRSELCKPNDRKVCLFLSGLGMWIYVCARKRGMGGISLGAR